MPGETKCLVSTDGRCSADLPVSLRLAVYRLTPTEERPVPRRLPPAACRLPPAACRLPPEKTLAGTATTSSQYRPMVVL